MTTTGTSAAAIASIVTLPRTVFGANNIRNPPNTASTALPAAVGRLCRHLSEWDPWTHFGRPLPPPDGALALEWIHKLR